MNQENLNDTEVNSLSNETKSENGLLGALAKCLTFAPLMLEQFTGQKIPHITGTMAEVQQGIVQLGTNLQMVINNQNKIWQKLTSLENNANQKLVNLTEQVKRISSVKLTHERERKRIEYNAQANQNEYQ